MTLTQRQRDHIDAHPDRSPYVVLDLDVVAHKYVELVESLPGVAVYYAVKANPAPDVLSLLNRMGSSFDVASIGEVRQCLDVGVQPQQMSFGNTVKKASAVREAVELGVTTFAFDSDSELDKLIELAPGSIAFCRVLCDGLGAAWPLSRKFGCTPGLAVGMLRRAARSGLRPGISFHVGSQQFDPAAWDRALALVADLRAELRADGIELELVNLGGGLPGSYVERVPPTAEYGRAITDAVRRRLGPALPPQLLVEPGRYLVGDAGALACEVVTVGRKSASDEHRWVYLDVGAFSGLAETLGEAIRYPIEVYGGAPGRASGPVVLAGPTCDSADILYETVDYELPLDLRPGERIVIRSVGAYTTSYSTVGFNGFPPLELEVLPATVDLSVVRLSPERASA
ncbi:MAG TPA: type III PLP-dependent enzyme [Actinomycetes bacterium]|nr:type III PLP-dependent enzyme [Actinomycetes bacterium]